MEAVQSLCRLTAKRIIFLWAPVLFWAGFIYYLSSIPGLAVGEGAVDFCTRKPAHVAEYAILFLLFWRAIRGSWALESRKAIFAAGVSTFLYAVLDEVHQIFVPLREGRVVDLGFDLLGIVAGAVLIHWWRRLSIKGGGDKR